MKKYIPLLILLNSLTACGVNEVCPNVCAPTKMVTQTLSLEELLKKPLEKTTERFSYQDMLVSPKGQYMVGRQSKNITAHFKDTQEKAYRSDQELGIYNLSTASFRSLSPEKRVSNIRWISDSNFLMVSIDDKVNTLEIQEVDAETLTKKTIAGPFSSAGLRLVLLEKGNWWVYRIADTLYRLDLSTFETVQVPLQEELAYFHDLSNDGKDMIFSVYNASDAFTTQITPPRESSIFTLNWNTQEFNPIETFQKQFFHNFNLTYSPQGTHALASHSSISYSSTKERTFDTYSRLIGYQVGKTLNPIKELTHTGGHGEAPFGIGDIQWESETSFYSVGSAEPAFYGRIEKNNISYQKLSDNAAYMGRNQESIYTLEGKNGQVVLASHKKGKTTLIQSWKTMNLEFDSFNFSAGKEFAYFEVETDTESASAYLLNTATGDLKFLFKQTEKPVGVKIESKKDWYL